LGHHLGARPPATLAALFVTAVQQILHAGATYTVGMVKLARLLSWLFALQALVIGAETLIFLWRVLPTPYRLAAAKWTAPLARTIAVLAVEPAALTVAAIVLGMASWTTLRGKPWARGWAIAASLIEILLAIAFLLQIGFPLWLLLGQGIAGLFVFSRRDVLAQMAAKASPPPRFPGDGTSRLAAILVRFSGVGGALAGYAWLVRWADAGGLPTVNSGLFFLLTLLADLISVAVHELGHAGAGLGLGMKLRAFIVGPLDWSVREGKWEFRFRPAALLGTEGGRAGLLHTSAADWRWRDVCMIVAGPLANLCLALVAMWATVNAEGRPWEPGWELLALISLISAFKFVGNLIPLRAAAGYSDGALIYQLLSNGPWADVHRTFSTVASSVVTPLRPRDYDIEALQRATQFMKHGNEGMLLRLFAYFHFFDCGRIPEALQAMAEAESVYEQSKSNLPEVPLEFVFGNAFLKRDAAAAHLWWERMEAKNLRRDSSDYWLARSALLWIENHVKEAREAWNKGNAMAQQLPNAGAYEFDRYRFNRLRQAFDTSSPPA